TVMLKLAGDLALERTYRLFVRGGSSGVRSVTGSTMSADFVQSPGFVTQSSDHGFPRVLYVAPLNGTIDVPVNAQVKVSFSEAMSRATLTASRIALVDDLGREVPQAAGSPTVSVDGRSVTIDFAGDLEH